MRIGPIPDEEEALPPIAIRRLQLRVGSSWRGASPPGTECPLLLRDEGKRCAGCVPTWRPTLRISRGAPCAPSAACACSADCRQPCPPFSGGNLHGCVKIDLSRCPARHHSTPAWARRTNTVSPHSAEMKLNRNLYALEG